VKLPRQISRFLLPSIAVLMLAFVIWSLTCPSSSDPKNPRYVLWKTGIYPMDPGLAAETMIADPHRDELVLGKSKEELRPKFGYLTAFPQAASYIQICYREQGMRYDDVMFIRNSTWMVVFQDGRAARLILFKGC
jgi:hypothetical protein